MFPALLTQRLLLRRLEPSDAEKVFAYRTDPDVARYQSWEPASIGELRTYIARLGTMDPLTAGEWFQLGITLRDTGELIGDCGLHARRDERRQVEIGITLAPLFQGQGFAVEAFRRLLEFLFTRTETHRAYCSVDPRNQRCLRLLAKIGLRQEALMIESLWIKDTWMDDVILAILRREWEAKHANP